LEQVVASKHAIVEDAAQRWKEDQMDTNFEACVVLAKKHLKRAQSTLVCEIKNYPTPIAGCDAQFNHLLEEKARVNAALDALNEQLFTPTPRQLTA
jgi:galactokinase